MFELKDKIVIVTGGASGIGASVVKSLLDEDVKHITIIDVAEETSLQDNLIQVYLNDKINFVKCDVSDKAKFVEAIEKVKEENGTIDVVINSAGILDEDFDSYDKEIDVNFKGVVTGSLFSWNIMNKIKGGNGGTIINIGSVTAVSNVSNIPVYSATKSGILKFGTSLGASLHYLSSDVRVITVCLGITITPLVLNPNKRFFDENITKEMAKNNFNIFKPQSPESASNGIIEAFKTGKSGSVWIITSGKPAIDVTDIYNKSQDIFDEYIHN